MLAQATRLKPFVRSICTRASSLVSTKQHGDVSVLRLDDGKMNAFSSSMIAEVHRALDEAESAGAVVLTGNAKCFSAGFDLSVMGKGPSADAGRLLSEGGELLFRLLTFKRPLVMAAPGHSMALGAFESSNKLPVSALYLYRNVASKSSASVS